VFIQAPIINPTDNMEIEMDYRDSLEEDEVEILLGDSLMIEEGEEVEEEAQREVQQEVQPEAQQEVQQENQQDVAQEVLQEVQQEVQQEVEEEAVETNSTLVIRRDVAPSSLPANERPAPKQSISNHPGRRQRPITNPSPVRVPQRAPTTHALPLGTPVAQQPDLMTTTTCHPPTMSEIAYQGRLMRARSKMYGEKPCVSVDPVIGQPLVKKRVSQEQADGYVRHMIEASHIRSENSRLDLDWTFKKANLEVRRDSTKRQIEWLEGDIRDKKFDIHFKKYVNSSPLIALPSCPFCHPVPWSEHTPPPSRSVRDELADASCLLSIPVQIQPKRKLK
jgi:hypothetical protein